VVIVSEERGEVGLALAGEFEAVGSAESLAERLQVLIYPQRQEKVHITVRQRLFRNLLPKLVTTFVVLVSWLVITTKQGGIFTVTVPIKYHNLPGNAVLLKSSPEEVEVQLKVFSSLIPSPKQLDVVADLDLANVRAGNNTLAIREGDLNLPLGVVVTSMNPSSVKVNIGKKIQKALQVQPLLKGTPSGRQRLQRVRVEPSQVVVEGPEHVLSGIDTIRTEMVNLDGIRQSTVVEAKLVSPSPQLRILNDEPVRVRIITSGKR
jgi:YbbR domain-containing protein